MSAVWCGLSDEEDDLKLECADCGHLGYEWDMIQLDYPDESWLCQRCWDTYRAAHPEWYEEDEDG